MLNQIGTDDEAISIIYDMVHDEWFVAFIKNKLDEKVDATSFKTERNGLKILLGMTKITGLTKYKRVTGSGEVPF